MELNLKRVAVLGSTGSIGKQALDVIDKHIDKFQVTVLTANNNLELLYKQAVKFIPKYVIIANEEKYVELKELLTPFPIQVLAGENAIAEVVKSDDIDIVLTAMVGYSGLLPTINAINAQKDIALANKETLVVAGELINRLAHKNGIRILPVDSEHSAIFQCLQGESDTSIEKIILTASGGPFIGKNSQFLKTVTKNEALKHPCWDMGAKVTIDSASLMNKGLEVIEAKWLFNLSVNQIEVVVHRQSIIHSMVQFTDGSIKAQMGLPDMRLPIQYALYYPERTEGVSPKLDFAQCSRLDFEPACFILVFVYFTRFLNTVWRMPPLRK
jgi:1-deoxy-D-xylulose-5-phosphate reductoisomerase